MQTFCRFDHDEDGGGGGVGGNSGDFFTSCYLSEGDFYICQTGAEEANGRDLLVHLNPLPGLICQPVKQTHCRWFGSQRGIYAIYIYVGSTLHHGFL